MPDLFQPFQLKDIRLRNRIAVPPMCQYSAVDGVPNDWHFAHYAGIARGGPGLVIVEATGVSPEGRITPGCLGLWNDEQAEGFAKIAASIKAAGSVAGIQIGHAGRKASANLPWEGDDHMPEADARGWETFSPSAVAHGANLPKIPRAMSLEDIVRVKESFVNAARRALDAGYEWLELHFAHGYLAQSFFSVHANVRTDEYGGDLAGRSRFLLETLAAVRKVWPERLPLTARFGVIEFDGRDEQTLAEAVQVSRRFRNEGLDFLNVSMGFTTPSAKIPWVPAFMVPIAEHMRRETGLPVSTAWSVDTPALASDAVRAGKLDLVMVGRGHLANPHWTYQTAIELNTEKPASIMPPAYAHWLSRYQAGTGGRQR